MSIRNTSKRRQHIRVILSGENISGKCFRSRTLQNLRQIADFVKSKRPRFEDLQKGSAASFFVDPAFGAASQFDFGLRPPLRMTRWGRLHSAFLPLFPFFVNTLDKMGNKCYTKDDIRLTMQGKNNINTTKSKHKEP